MPDLPTGTVTFLFTDIEGSTRLWEQHPEAMRVALARHDALLRKAIESQGGHVFKTVGDAFCAAFATAPDAVGAALTAQRTLRAEPWDEAGPLRVRMALHTGAAEQREGDYFGPPLNRVARLLDAGHGGQLLISQATVDLVRDTLAEAVSLRDLGTHRLKDLQQPEHLYQLVHPDLPGEFPALRSLEAFAHNLPRQLTSFIGREPQMADVKQLLTTTALLTLTGSGGCGKTRLALQVAAELVEEFADGVWLVELAALADPMLVPQTVASALGVREEPGRSLEATLADYLRGRSLLLVLDNCEHLLDACAQLVDRLLRACPKLRVMASSREGLGIAGEVSYRVSSLSLPDLKPLLPVERLQEVEAVRLFADRATMSQPSFALTEQNAPAVAQICHRLDGIPLAIELAAARVKALPVEKLNERLDDLFRLLTGGSRTALPRQQTLRALIDWSYDLLTEAERTLLRRLSVFAGGWTLEATEAVCGDGVESCQLTVVSERTSPSALSTVEVLDLLTALVDKSLVVYREGEEARYRLLESVRQYARDRLVEARESEAVRHRHLEFFLALAERAEPELRGSQQLAWLGRLETEHDNCRMALEWCCAEEGRTELGLRLAGALWRFWKMRNYFREGRQWLERTLTGTSQDTVAARVKALCGAGEISRFQGDLVASRAFMEESLAAARQTGDRWTTAYSLFHLGMAAAFESSFAEATALGEEAMALVREAGDKWLLAHPHNLLALVATFQGEYERAAALYQASLALAREAGDKWVLAMTLGGLAVVKHYQHDHEQAGALRKEELALWRELGDKRGIATSLEQLAWESSEQGQAEPAARLMAAAEALREATGADLPGNRRPLHERAVTATRAALGEEAFAAAWAEGRAMTLQQVVAYALEERADA